MHIRSFHMLAVLGGLLVFPLVSTAQFRDLTERPRTDTTAINEFIKSYHRQLEPIYVHTTASERFGPLSAFTRGSFVSEDASTLPLESAEKLVTLHGSGVQGALVGAGVGTAIGLMYALTVGTSNSSDAAAQTGNAYVKAGVGTIGGALVGFVIGLFIPREENAAPMNAFRMR